MRHRCAGFFFGFLAAAPPALIDRSQNSPRRPNLIEISREDTLCEVDALDVLHVLRAVMISVDSCLVFGLTVMVAGRSIVTLGMLLLLESIVVKQRLGNLRELRRMRPEPYSIYVYRYVPIMAAKSGNILIYGERGKRGRRDSGGWVASSSSS